MFIVPNNWAELQHYKDRSPPWIKLHKKLLDNFEWHSLPVASRALAPMLWLLASDHEKGEIDALPKKLAFRLRMSEAEVIDAIKPLIDNGFFCVVRVASAALATPGQIAIPETETETETEKRKEGESAAKPLPPRGRKKSEARTLAVYIDECRTAQVKPIPDDHYIRRWADEAGLQPEMLQIAWVEFKARYLDGEKGKGKRYKDWPGHFATAVKDNWLKLWFFSEGEMNWTSLGLTKRAVLEARSTKREAGHESA